MLLLYVYVLCERSLKLTDDGVSLKMKAYVRNEEKRAHTHIKIRNKKKKKKKEKKVPTASIGSVLYFVSPIGIFVVRFLRSVGHCRIFNGACGIANNQKHIFGTFFGYFPFFFYFVFFRV